MLMPPSGICSRARTHACMHLYLRLCMHMHTRRTRSVGEFAGHWRTSPLNNTRFRRAVPFADDSFTSSSRVRRREFLRAFPARRDDIPACRGYVFQRERILSMMMLRRTRLNSELEQEMEQTAFFAIFLRHFYTRLT